MDYKGYKIKVQETADRVAQHIPIINDKFYATLSMNTHRQALDRAKAYINDKLITKTKTVNVIVHKVCIPRLIEQRNALLAESTGHDGIINLIDHIIDADIEDRIIHF